MLYVELNVELNVICCGRMVASGIKSGERMETKSLSALGFFIRYVTSDNA